MNRKKRRKLTAYLLALVMIFSCFGQSTGMAADYQAESKSAAVQSGESEIATGDAVTTATAATIEPTITPAEPPAAESTATPLVTPYPVQDSDTTDFEIGAQNAKCKQVMIPAAEVHSNQLTLCQQQNQQLHTK